MNNTIYIDALYNRNPTTIDNEVNSRYIFILQCIGQGFRQNQLILEGVWAVFAMCGYDIHKISTTLQSPSPLISNKNDYYDGLRFARC